MKWIFFLCCFFPFFSFTHLLEEANAYYLKGEKAATFEERQEAFNQALDLYFQAAEKEPSPFLYQMLGDTFYQLEEYSWAILYYEKNLRKELENLIVRQRLNQIQEKKELPLSLQKKDSFFVFWGLLLFCFFICSWCIWKEKYFKTALSAVLFFLIFCFFLLFKSFYSSPAAVLVQSSGLYVAPDFSAPLFLDSGLIEGSIVSLLYEEKEGEWLWVRSVDGKTGYIPFFALRSVD